MVGAPFEENSTMTSHRPSARLIERRNIAFGWRRIDLYPVVAHFRAYDFARCFRYDSTRRLNGHMTVDAILRDPGPHGFRHTAVFDTVAAQASGGIRCRRPLRRVYVVAGRARHIRRGKVATATLQQPNLVSMHVGMRHNFSHVGLEIVIQRLARYK